MNIRVRKYADLSTGHISMDDAKILAENSKDANDQIMVSPFAYGWFFRLGDDEHYATDEDARQEFLDQGLSPALWEVLKTCAAEGFQGICFDNDGDYCEALPYYYD